MLKKMYDATLKLAAHPQAIWWLFLVAFAESFIFPVPQDVMMIPMILATPHRAWRIALVATLGSALGGIAGYGIGALLYESLGASIIGLYGYGSQYAAFQDWYTKWGVLLVAGGAFTPLPFKVITIASGAAGMSFPLFLLAAIPVRALRFFLIAGLLLRFGPAVRNLLERRLGLVTTVATLLVIAGFVALKWV